MRPGVRHRVASSRVGHCAAALAVVWPLSAAHAAPLDNAIESLNEVAFISGHAPAAGGVIAMRSQAPMLAGYGGHYGFPITQDLAASMARPVEAREEQGLRLGGQVPVQTVGAFLQGKLRELGVKDGATQYGAQGRFYLFAAVHGQAVGLNLQTQGGSLHRTGWSTDQTSALVGDGQVGLGWRKGGMEAAIGYVHRGVHLRNTPVGASDSYTDDMGALSLTFHPHW
jgi:hypothetical protein